MNLLESAESFINELTQLEQEVIAGDEGVIFTFVCDYTVHWNRIENERDLLSWVYHLTEKTWFTPERSRRFMELVAEKNGFDLHCAP